MVTPLNLTVSPKLDAALGESGFAWERAAAGEGAARATAWLVRRLGGDADREEIAGLMTALLSASDEEGAVSARIELAERIEEEDDALADALWESVLAHGIATDDGDLIFEAASHLAAIAERHADPLAAAEYLLEFLNWRRLEDHASDPDAVQAAFEEVVRLAEEDGEPKSGAFFGARLVGFSHLADQEDERATVGDWEKLPTPYTSWA